LEFQETIKHIAVDLTIQIISDVISLILHQQFLDLIISKSPDTRSQILGVAAAVAIGFAFVFGYRVYEKLNGPIKEKSINIYQRRNIRLEDFLDKAKEQIHIFGIALEETLSGEYTEILVTRYQTSSNFTFKS
jgi:hypothetical protein